jgi:formate hydrogenlyase subunit 4
MSADLATRPAIVSAFVAWVVLLLTAPLVPGLAAKTRSLLTGRRGAPVWQLYADLWKLLRRGTVYSDTATAIFRLVPVVLAVTTVLAAALVPLDGRRSLIGFSGDAVAFVYLLALGRLLLVLGAFDTGSSFGGMGASREVTLASLVEPGLFISLAALVVATHRLTLTGMLGAELWSQPQLVAPTVLLLAGSIFVLMLAECARVPVDDPATHLELTMIHEVMVLDHSGPDLALILYSGALKLGLFAALLVVLVVRRTSVPAWLASLELLGGLLVVGMAIGVVEGSTARLRLPKVPLYVAGGAALACFGLILVLQ